MPGGGLLEGDEVLFDEVLAIVISVLFMCVYVIVLVGTSVIRSHLVGVGFHALQQHFLAGFYQRGQLGSVRVGRSRGDTFSFLLSVVIMLGEHVVVGCRRW